MKNFNYKLGLLVLAISLAVFFGGNWFAADYKVSHALPGDLKEIKGVKAVKIVSAPVNYKVQVTLNQVKDLQQIFAQVRRKTEQSLDEKTYKLEFAAPVGFSKQLESEVELALYEACQTGEFVKLGQRVKAYQQKYNLEETIIQVDGDYIYLSLIKNNQALYKVISRRRKG